MKVDTHLDVSSWAALPDEARRLEAAGYDRAWTSEISHDPFLPLGVAAAATSRISLGTAITVAFARSPMTTAYVANDLQAASRGRFTLGVGSQVRAHITRRFSMPWGGRPAAQMREYILALRAIWAAWNDGKPLDVRGEYYQHTLMTAMFRPEPHSYGPPPIFLAAVGEKKTRVAGEVADGLLLHSFTTERYLREVTLPALADGAARAGRSPRDIKITCPGFVVIDDGSREASKRITAARRRIAFYASTPAYRPVLELYGWGDLADRLHALSVTSDEGRWAAMGEMVDDEVLNTFAVIGRAHDVGTELKRRYGDVVDRVRVSKTSGLPPDQVPDLLAALR